MAIRRANGREVALKSRKERKGIDATVAWRHLAINCRFLHHTLHLSIVEKLPRCPERYTFVGTLPGDTPTSSRD